jgi:small subunit ribosomal protein S20
MPRCRTSIKKQRVDKKRHLYNLRVKRNLMSAIKKFKRLLQAKNIAEAKSQLNKVFSSLDKAAKKKTIHKNLASRKKSRLARLLLKATEVNQKPL